MKTTQKTKQTKKSCHRQLSCCDEYLPNIFAYWYLFLTHKKIWTKAFSKFKKMFAQERFVGFL